MDLRQRPPHSSSRSAAGSRSTSPGSPSSRTTRCSGAGSTRALSGYLVELWQAGALRGATAEDAFYVKCDADTNPDEVRAAGRVVTEVGLAPSVPNEFVTVRVVLGDGAAALGPNGGAGP